MVTDSARGEVTALEVQGKLKSTSFFNYKLKAI